MMLKKCRYCGKNITISVNYKRNKFCKKECSDKWHKNRHKGSSKIIKPKRCIICGGNLKRLNKKFCSCKCHGKYLKDKTYIQIYGKEKSKKIKEKRSNNFKNIILKDRIGKKKYIIFLKAMKKLRRDKTYEQIYGINRAKQIKRKIGKKSGNFIRNKTFEQVYSKEKADKIRGKLGQYLKNKTFEQVYGKKKANELIKLKSGKNSYFYIHGNGYEPYDSNFNNKLKKQIAERDEYICQVCNKKVKKGTCHHIHYNKRDTSPKTLVWTHLRCNISCNFNRDYWFAYFCELKNINPEVIV